MKIVDAHHHYWDLSRPDCGWPTPDLTPIYRSYQPDEFASVTACHNVMSAVLVQSQPAITDTHYLLTLAEQNVFIGGVVGWVDMQQAEAPVQIDQLAQSGKLRGLRPMLEMLDDVAWIADPALDPAVAAMKQHGLRLDALVGLPHLPHLYQFVQKHRDLLVVIDHGAKPQVLPRAHNLPAWRRALEPLAALPNVYCKLSGLVTEAHSAAGEKELYPYVQLLVALFGPERLMWGSDWPVVNLNGDYSRWLQLAKRTVTKALMDAGAGNDKIEHQLQAIFADTACHFYRIPAVERQ